MPSRYERRYKTNVSDKWTEWKPWSTTIEGVDKASHLVRVLDYPRTTSVVINKDLGDGNITSFEYRKVDEFQPSMDFDYDGGGEGY